MDNTDFINEMDKSEGQLSECITELISPPKAEKKVLLTKPEPVPVKEDGLSGNAAADTAAEEQCAETSQEKLEQSEQSEQPEKPLSDREVMAHTEGVWQYKEIIDNGTEMHSESHEKRLELPFGEVLGARVRGKKHKHEGTNCDDFFEVTTADDAVIAIVCDGAGSKPLSRIGSRVSCECAAAFLKSELTHLFAENADLKKQLAADLASAEFMAACGKIAQLVQESARTSLKAQTEKAAELADNEKYENALGRKPVLSDFSVTFLAAVAVPLTIDGTRQTFMACVQIGDGCVCAIDSRKDSDDCLRLLGEADSGKFSGETDFLSEKNTKPDVISSKTRISRGSSDVIMLMSDGVADDYFPNVPMMKRLYLDLCLNGIVPFDDIPENKYCGEDPAPVRFRSVSLSRQSVALQYAKQLLSDSSADSVNALWDKRKALYCHSLEAFRMNIGDTPEERLRVWLDNYNERGSFDDRSLVVIRFSDILQNE